MSKMLATLVAIAAAIPAAAHALDINCLAPVVSLGSPGNSSGVRVAIDENGLAWQVSHDLSDGRVISRADQYQVTDERHGANGVNPFYGWIGLLKRSRNLMMIGKLYNRGGLFYEEKLIDFGHNPKGDLIMDSTAYCGPERDAAPPQIAGPDPLQQLFAPPPQASLAPPPPPQPVVAPPSGGGDVVPIAVDHGRARVAVNFANYPLPQTMVIDTGASIMSATNELAAALIDRGMAYRMDQQTNICLADGACQTRDQIMVQKLSIGGRTVMDVPAIMVPDNVEMLLPFRVLNQAGKFTIDTANGLLIFG